MTALSFAPASSIPTNDPGMVMLDNGGEPVAAYAQTTTVTIRLMPPDREMLDRLVADHGLGRQALVRLGLKLIDAIGRAERAGGHATIVDPEAGGSQRVFLP